MVILASMIGNIFNLLYNVYLVRSQIINFQEFGLISLIGSILALSQIPLSGFSRTITHRSAYLYGKYATPIKSFWTNMRLKTLKPSILLTILWLISIPFLATTFHTNSFLPFLLLTPVWTICLMASVDAGFLNGNLRLKTIGIMMVAEVISKFVITVIVVELGFLPFIYAAIPLSIIISFLIGWAAARRMPKENKIIDKRIINHFPKKFYASSVLAKLSSLAFLNIDIILAKNFLPPAEAGQYAVLSLAGKMVYFLGTLFTQFVNPFVSRDEGAGRNSRHIFSILMAGSLTAVTIGIIIFGIFGRFTVPFILGNKTTAILRFLPLYAVAMGCLVIGNGIMTYYQSRNIHIFATVSFTFSTLALGSIFFYHRSIADINFIIVISGILYLILMLGLHLTQINFWKRDSTITESKLVPILDKPETII